ncbi:MAG: 16S rRNA (cytosine(967)-C(5))-methyltransferase RsmB [Lachnospiraceae bacterium]
MANAVNTREIVLDVLLTIEKGETFSHKVLKDTLDKYDYLDRKDKAFMKRMVDGTLERQIYLDYVLDHISNTPVKKMKPLIRVLLRMSMYQILYMDQVPDRAVCNEAVKLCAKRKFVNLKGFINGILRKVCSQKDQLPIPDRSNMSEYLSVTHSMPMWIVEKWISELGVEKTERVLEDLLSVKPVTIRVKQSLSDTEVEELIKEMLAKGIEVSKHTYMDRAYKLSHLDGLYQVPGFSNGLITVQDVSSMLAVEVAGITPGDFVLDVCAAPGGKTMLAAEKTGPTGRVLARDISDMKVSYIEENAGRMQLDQVQVQVHDALVLDESLIGKVDVVLADLPCSGLGIMGKKRDIKYHVSKESLVELQHLQKQMLEVVSSYVKPGGVLVYSTCTINPDENEHNRMYILDELGFEAESLDDALLVGLQGNTTREGYLQLLPGMHDTDGFFISRFRKK